MDAETTTQPALVDMARPKPVGLLRYRAEKIKNVCRDRVIEHVRQAEARKENKRD